MEQEELSSHSKIVAKGSFWNLTGSIAFKLSSFFYTILIARAASQADVGLFYLSLGIIGLIGIFSDLGLSGSLVRYMPFYEGKGEHGKRLGLLRLSVLVSFFLGVFLSIIIYWQADNVGGFYSNPRLADALRFISLYALIQNLFRSGMSYLQAIADMKTGSLANNLQNVGKLFLTIILFYFFGASVLTITAAFILSFVPCLVFIWIRSKELMGILQVKGEAIDNRELVHEIAPFGLLLILLGALGAIMSSTDRLVLGYMASKEAAESLVGIYSIATALAISLGVFPGAVNSIFLPVISKLAGKEDWDSMRAIMRTSQRWAMFVSIPVAVVMIIFSSDLLRIFYGVSYQSGAFVLSAFTLGYLISYVFSVVSNAILAKRLINLELTLTAITAVVNLALCIVLIPTYSLDGAALAALISFLVMTLLLAYYGKKIFDFTIPPEIYRLFGAGLASFLVVFLLKPIVSATADSLPAITSLGDFAPYAQKLLYLAYVGILMVLSTALFVLFSLLLKCIHGEDISLMKGVLRRAFVPPQLISLAERIASYGVTSK